MTKKTMEAFRFFWSFFFPFYLSPPEEGYKVGNDFMSVRLWEKNKLETNRQVLFCAWLRSVSLKEVLFVLHNIMDFLSFPVIVGVLQREELTLR